MSALVVLSGGMDSAAALTFAVQGHADTRAISFDYGQRHSRELASATAVAAHYAIPHHIVNVRGLLHGSSLLFAGDVPEGHYAEASMKSTVVNGRNLLFASVAVAAAQPGSTLFFGVHAGDHPVYPDCRPEFWEGLRWVVRDAYDVTLATPFVMWEKRDIVSWGAANGTPFHLTWSCYQGGDQHCGRCGTCVERAEAFSLAGVEDPTAYADHLFWRTAKTPEV